MSDGILSFEVESSVPGSVVHVLASEIACIHSKDGVPQLIMKNGGGFIVVSDVEALVKSWAATVSGDDTAENDPGEIPGVPVPDWLKG